MKKYILLDKGVFSKNNLSDESVLVLCYINSYFSKSDPISAVMLYPDAIWFGLTENVDITRREKLNIIFGIEELISMKLIKLIYRSGSKYFCDVSPCVMEHNNFFSVKSSKIKDILNGNMDVYNIYLFRYYINICSRFYNVKFKNNNIHFMIKSYNTISKDFGISINTISKYNSCLRDMKIISIILVNKNGNYCNCYFEYEDENIVQEYLEYTYKDNRAIQNEIENKSNAG